jgi:hypothetical protein
MKLTRENRQLGEKPVPVPLRPPQISHGLDTEDTQILDATVQTYSKYHLYYRHQTSVIPVTAV